jgi:hypothetical protein
MSANLAINGNRKISPELAFTTPTIPGMTNIGITKKKIEFEDDQSGDATITPKINNQTIGK